MIETSIKWLPSTGWSPETLDGSIGLREARIVEDCIREGIEKGRRVAAVERPATPHALLMMGARAASLDAFTRRLDEV